MKLSPGKIIATLVGAALVFYLGNRLSEFVRATFSAGQGTTDWTGAFLAHLRAAPLAISTHNIDLIAGGALAGLLVLIVLYQVGAKQNRRRGEEQGSAGWADAKDAAKIGNKDRSRRLQMTATEALSLDSYKTQKNTNVLVIGGSGSGKSRHYVIPNVAALGASIAVTDPKGEIREATEDLLIERGYQVRTLNLVNLYESQGFNPLRYFDPESPETGIIQLAEGIVTNTNGTKPDGKDAFWDRAERALLTALIAYVWATTPDTNDHEASLADVTDLHKNMAAGEGRAAQMRSEVDIQFDAAREIVAEWEADGRRGDEEEQRIMRVLDFAARQYRIYQQGPGETKMSVIISLGVRLAPLDMHDVRQIISTDTIGLEDLSAEPTALFLELPDTHAAFNFIAAMFWQSLFEKTIYLSDHSEPRGLERPVHCFLDEFANIGKIPNFERVIATIRSRGISASIVVQSYSQGKALWGEDWNTIVGNCDSVLYLGTMDFDTREWISKQLGDETVVTEETSRSYGANGSSTRANHFIKRQLMTPEEVGRIDITEALLLVRGMRPFRSKKQAALDPATRRRLVRR